MKTQVERILLMDHPYPELIAGPDHAPYHSYDQWPCCWITFPGNPQNPFTAAYTKEFEIEKECTVRIHVSGDERYELYLDYELIGRGSERGNPQNWFYETYDITFAPGIHRFSARVWSLGSKAPWAQLSVHHGFILSPEGEENIKKFGTGTSDWLVKKLEGYIFEQTGKPLHHYPGTGVKPTIDGSQFSWGWEYGEGGNWTDPVKMRAGTNDHTQFFIPSNSHIMRPALLPEMMSSEIRDFTIRSVMDVEPDQVQDEPVRETAVPDEWKAFIHSGSISIPEHTATRVIIDLNTYHCAYQDITVEGGKGSEIRLEWAETLSQTDGNKGNRDEIEGKLFRGTGNIFLPDGEDHRRFSSLWWHAGRYVCLYVKTGSEPLVIENLTLTSVHYPYTVSGRFECDNTGLNNSIPILWRSIEMCSHEIYMDCPYYEQLMYVGDTRLQVLTTYTQTGDIRLPKKAVLMLEQTRAQGTPWVDCSFPNDRPKLIPSFSLWWVGMVYDYALWRNDPETVRHLMPGVRSQVDLFLNRRNSDGLIETPPGWNYIDVAVDPEKLWKHGTPPGEGNICVELNMIGVYTFKLAAELEDEFGDREVAARNRTAAERLMSSLTDTYFNMGRGLFAYTPGGDNGSEHSLAIALLTGLLKGDVKEKAVQTFTGEHSLAKANTYFAHYPFESFTVLDRTDLIMERLAPWIELPAHGFTTTPEQWGTTRSDCHAWGAHPLYHFITSFCGIRPSEFGFRKVRITPRPASLGKLSCTIPHPEGFISTDMTAASGNITGTITLPETITGKLILPDSEITLHPGTQEF